jgi:hypothetical protein
VHGAPIGGGGSASDGGADLKCKWMWEDAGDYLGKLGKKLAQRANPVLQAFPFFAVHFD